MRSSKKKVENSSHEAGLKDDKRYGLKKTHFPDGKIKKEITWLDDVYFSNYKSFYQNGKIKAQSALIKKSESMSEPDIYSFETFNDKEKPLYKGQCSIGLEEFGGEYCRLFSGQQYSYNDKDELVEETQWVLGKLEGSSKLITDSEVIISTYQKNKIVKKVISDRKTNKVIKTEEYNADGSRK